VFLTEFDIDKNFKTASNDVHNVTVHNPQELNVLSILNSEYLIATKEGLKQFEIILESRHANHYRNKRIPREPNAADFLIPDLKNRLDKKFDPIRDGIIEEILNNDDERLMSEKPLAVMSRGLRGYVKEMQEEQTKRIA